MVGCRDPDNSVGWEGAMSPAVAHRALTPMFLCCPPGQGNQFLTYVLVALSALPILMVSNTDIAAGICGTLWPKYACLYKTYNITPLSAGLCVALVMPLVIFPYQSAPILIQRAARFWSREQFTKVAVINAVLVAFIVLPLTLLWWFPACSFLQSTSVVSSCNANFNHHYIGGVNVTRLVHGNVTTFECKCCLSRLILAACLQFQ